MLKVKLALAGTVLAGLSLVAAASAQGAPNAVSVIQGGRGNAAGISQTGTGHDAALRQFGQNNSGAILQSGTGNTACLAQAGRHLSGTIQQTGDDQSLGVLQTRMGVMEVSADACSAIGSRRDIMVHFAGRAGNPMGRGRR
jgi:hypothetical protein